MIFTGKDDGLNILGRSRSDIADVWSGANGWRDKFSSAGNMFVPSVGKYITEKDKTLLEEYAKALETTTDRTADFNKIMKGASKNARNLAQSADFSKASLEGVKTVTVGTTAAMVGARIAAIALNAALSFGIGLAIQGVIQGITWLFTASERAAEDAKRAAEEAAERAKNAAESAKSLKESLKDIEDYQKKVNDLSDTINNNNTSQAEALTARQQLLEIQKELIEKYGLEKEVIDGITSALNGEKDALDGVKKSAAGKWLSEHQSDITEAEDYVNDTVKRWIHWDGTDTSGRNYIIEESAFKAAQEKGNTMSWDSWESYLLEPFVYVDSWIKSHSDIAGYGDGSKMGETQDTTEFSIKGTREEVVSRYRELLLDMQQYMTDNNDSLTEAQRNAYTALAGKISDKINELANDETYQNSLTTLDTAIENVLTYNETLSDSYNKLNKAISDLEQAGLENNPELIRQSIENLDNIHNSLLEFINPDNSYNGVSGKVLRDYIEKLFSSDAINKVRLKDYISPNDIAGILNIVSKNQLTKEGIQAIFSEFERDSENAQLSSDEKYLRTAIQQYIDKYNSDKNQNIGYQDLLQAMVDLGYLRTDTKKGYDNFSLSDYSDELDKLGDQVKTLKDAYDKFMEGKLTDEDIMKLITDKEKGFLELSDYVDDIGTGITTVAEEKINALINKLSKIDIETLNEKELASYNKFINYLYDLKSGFSDLTLQQGQFRSEMKKTYGIIENLTKFKEDLTKNGKLSASNLKTIEDDDTYSELRGITDPKKLLAAIEAFLTRAKKDYKNLAISANEYNFNTLIRKTDEEVKKFNEMYEVDLSNWEELGEDKIKAWQGTSLEILSKQKKLIDDFKNIYSIDLRNYKSLLEAKAALTDNFWMSDKYKEIIRDIGNDLGNNHGRIYYTGDQEKRNRITKELNEIGLSWEEFIDYLNGKSLPESYKNRVDKYFEDLSSLYPDIFDSDLSELDWDSLLDIGKTTDESKQNLDWIERRLKKFAQTTKEVYADVEKYTDFTGKNSQLNKSISAISNEIRANEDAYNAYMSAANAVNLSSAYKSKVQNGTLNIENIADADLRNKISEYQDLYDKALACKDTVESLKKTEKEYASQQLSNIESYYNARIKSIQADQTFYNSADTDNLNVKKNFDKLRELYQKEITETEKEAGDLRNTLNNLYSRGLITPEQYEEENEKIKQLNNSLRDTKKKVRDLADEELNYISNRASNRLDILKSESDLLVSSAEDPFYKKEKNYNSIRSNYRQQISIQEGLANDLQKRLDKAVSSGEFEKFGSRWYEWTDKINEAKNNANDLKKSIHELYSEELEDIKNLRDANIGIIENEITKANSKRANSDKVNYFDKELEYLNNAAKLNEQKRNELKQERQEIAKKFKEAVKNGLEEGSEIWKEFEDSLSNIDNQLIEVDGELNNISDSLRDLPVQKISQLAEIIGKIRDTIKDLQSLHEAQGYDLTSEEIYSSINSGTAQLLKLKNERDLILSDMKKGKYGAVGSEDWNEALDKVLSLYSDMRQIQIDQEKEYDSLIDLEIDKLNKEKEQMMKQNTELEKRLALEKAILALEKAKYQKNKLVYHEGLGFVYEADQNAIRDAQEELDKQYREGVLDHFDKVVELLEDYKKFYNIYDYSGDKLSEGAYDDSNLEIDGIKYTTLKPNTEYLESVMPQLDPSVAKLFASVFNSNVIPKQTEDYQNNVIKNLSVISSNFAELQKPNQVQFTISKDAIHLYGVNNTNELAQAIINYLPTQIVQDLHKK